MGRLKLLNVVNPGDVELAIAARNALPKLLAFVDAYDWWLNLFKQDGREDLPDDGSLELAVQYLDSAREALDEQEIPK